MKAVDVKGASSGRRRTLVGAGAGLAVAVAGIGAGAAYATSGAAVAGGASGTGVGSAVVRQVADSTTPPGSTGTAPKGPGDHRRPPLRDRALRLGGAVEHGELVVKAKDGTRTISVQRGTVTENADGTLTVTSEDTTAWSYVLDAKTHVRKDGEKAGVADLAKGDEVRVFAEVQDGKRIARLVLDGRPPHPMRPGTPGAPGAPAGPDQGSAPSTAPGAAPSSLDDAWEAQVLGA